MMADSNTTIARCCDCFDQSDDFLKTCKSKFHLSELSVSFVAMLVLLSPHSTNSVLLLKSSASNVLLLGI